MRTHDIEVDDKVVFLYDHFIFHGTVLKVNQKTYKIHVPAQRMCIDFEKNVKKDRVAHVDDSFAVVWERDVGVNGRYRIEFELYAGHHATYQAWREPYMYITESED